MTAVRNRKLCPTSSNEKLLSAIEIHYGKSSKRAICVCSVDWRSIWIDATDENWIQRAREASSSDTTRRESLLVDGSRYKTSGGSKNRDIQWEHHSRLLYGWQWAIFQNIEVSIKTCIDIGQPNTTETSQANWARHCRFSGGHWGKQVEEEEDVDSHSTDQPEQRSVRTRNPPTRYVLAYTHASVTGVQELRGYSEALPGPKKTQWLAAMVLEVKSIEAMWTWTIVDRLQFRSYSWTMGSCCK